MRRIGQRPQLKPDSGTDKEQLLYVEDSDDNWRVAELRLGEMYELHRASTSRLACGFLRAQGHELTAILMDIELRGSEMNGIDLTRLIKGTADRSALPNYALHVPQLDVPIIFVTAHGAKYSDEELLKVGGSKVIGKPVDFTALTFALTQLHLRRTLAPRG